MAQQIAGEPMVVKFTLPGTKQQRGELPNVAAIRVLREQLLPMFGCVETLGMQRETKTESSRRMQIATTYHRTEVHMNYSGGLDASYRLSGPMDPPPSPASLRRMGSQDQVSSMEAPQSLLESLARREVFAIRVRQDGHRSTFTNANSVLVPREPANKQQFFAWMQEDEIERLRGNSGEVILKHWLAVALSATVADQSQAIVHI